VVLAATLTLQSCAQTNDITAQIYGWKITKAVASNDDISSIVFKHLAQTMQVQSSSGTEKARDQQAH
jgi:hypothetical protein